MIHDMAYKRHMDWTKAIRKRRISDNWFDGDEHYYRELHCYSKNKIHCSCQMCARKTNNKKYNFYGPPKNYKASDKRKIKSMEQQEEEFFANINIL